MRSRGDERFAGCLGSFVLEIVLIICSFCLDTRGPFSHILHALVTYFEIILGSTFLSFSLKEALSYGEYSSPQSALQSTRHVSGSPSRYDYRC